MKGLFVTDSSCCLPEWYFEQHSIVRIPHFFRLENGKYFNDMKHDEGTRLRLYQQGFLEKEMKSEVIHPTTKIIYKYALDDYVDKVDFIYCQSNSSDATRIYSELAKVEMTINADTHAKRQAAGLTKPLIMRVHDSGTLAGGHGVILAHTMDLLAQGMSLTDITEEVARLRPYTKGFFHTPDMVYLYKRAQQIDQQDKAGFGSFVARMVKTVNITPIFVSCDNQIKPVKMARGSEQTISRLFDYALRQIESGNLLSRYISVGYVGVLDEIEDLGLSRLRDAAFANDLTLFECMAPFANAHAFGAKSINVGLICKDNKLKM